MPSIFSDPTKAKELLGHHSKPQTAVTDWIDRMCDPRKSSSEYDINTFMIELVEIINLQPTGPEEASRAIRKQLKHGRPSQQAKSIIILEALVLNGGNRFRTTFADTRLIECLKSLTSDTRADLLLRRRILLMLNNWERIYGSDPKMIVPSSLFKICGGKEKLEKISSSISSSKAAISSDSKPSFTNQQSTITGTDKPSISQLDDFILSPPSQASSKNQKKEMKKRQQKLKSSPIDQRYRTELTLPDSNSSLKKFDIVKERPKILQAVASAAQNANNLVNRLQLIEATQITTDSSIKALIEQTKLSQKPLLRYIQTVPDHDPEGEYLGTLLNTNAQVLTALELYNALTQSKVGDQIDHLPGQFNCTTTPNQEPNSHDEVDIFGEMSRTVKTSDQNLSLGSPSADLLGLDFGTAALSKAGGDQLQVPLVPNPVATSSFQSRTDYDPGTLSDFSDFEDDDVSFNCSSENDTNGTPELTASLSQKAIIATANANNPFLKYFDPLTNQATATLTSDNPVDSSDPFADPFADSPSVVTPPVNNHVLNTAKTA